MEFAELIDRVRSGDGEAATQLVNRYETAIRVAVRTRLTDPRLRREFDSMDVCQSVLVSFFLRAALGQFNLNEPEQLVALLIKMARNKLAMRVRASTRQRRDLNRVSDWQEPFAVPDAGSDGVEPLRNLIGRELLERAHQMMPAEIRQIADLRTQLLSWDKVAEILGGTAEARRKQFERAVDRIAMQLELHGAGTLP